MMKKFEKIFTCFDIIHKHDRHPEGHTDKRTLHDGIGHAYAQHYVASSITLCVQCTCVRCVETSRGCQRSDAVSHSLDSVQSQHPSCRRAWRMSLTSASDRLCRWTRCSSDRQQNLTSLSLLQLRHSQELSHWHFHHHHCLQHNIINYGTGYWDIYNVLSNP